MRKHLSKQYVTNSMALYDSFPVTGPTSIKRQEHQVMLKALLLRIVWNLVLVTRCLFVSCTLYLGT